MSVTILGSKNASIFDQNLFWKENENLVDTLGVQKIRRILLENWVEKIGKNENLYSKSVFE